MKVSIDNNQFFVGWRYDQQGKTPTTTCVIKDATKEIVAEAEVKLYHKDTFDKDAARKFSLSKTISTFPKNKRRQFWNAYLQRKNSGLVSA